MASTAFASLQQPYHLSSALDIHTDPCAVEPYAPKVLLEPFAPFDPSEALIYRYRQQISVNLGSWFVLEDWMSPSMFRCAQEPKQAELDVVSGWGGVRPAGDLMRRHWDEWITEKDFKWIADAGLNTVRLPIGFWDLGPEYCTGTAFEPAQDVYEDAWPRIVRAINWADKYDLGVLVDLHGAPGSQNGLSHSGYSGGKQDLFDSEENQTRTIEVLLELSRRLVNVTNVVGIQLLNEPSNVENLDEFYDAALQALRNLSDASAAFPYYIHDAYDLSRLSDYAGKRKDFVVLDHHSYYVFGSPEEQQRPLASLLADLVSPNGTTYRELSDAAAKVRGNLVVDEWSCALTGDAMANLGSDDVDKGRKSFCDGQAEVYANLTAGWSFWSLKSENCDGDDNWCFQRAVGRFLPKQFRDNALSSPGDHTAICKRGDGGKTHQLHSSDTPSHNASAANAAHPLLPSNAHSSVQSHHLVSRSHQPGFPMATSAQSCRCGDNDSGELSVALGYADGWRSANVFAHFHGSKIGFVPQFVVDQFMAFCGLCDDPIRDKYSEWFMRGVKDAGNKINTE